MTSKHGLIKAGQEKAVLTLRNSVNDIEVRRTDMVLNRIEIPNYTTGRCDSLLLLVASNSNAVSRLSLQKTFVEAFRRPSESRLGYLRRGSAKRLKVY